MAEKQLRKTDRNDAWKGLHASGENESQSFFESASSKKDDVAMDMTPMVDITFLLLVFFMVTASFVVSQAIPVNAAERGGPTPELKDLDQVEIAINEYNEFTLKYNDIEELAVSDRALRGLLRMLTDEYNVEEIVINAHVDSAHVSCVNAWNAGKASGIDQISMRTFETN